jgi:1,6-anhydro-N-acetylmuramate kinase
VGDFRSGDVAIGGQERPLAPYGDYMLRRSDKTNRTMSQHRRHFQPQVLPKAVCARM